MEVYNEKTLELIESPDLSKGYVYNGEIEIESEDNYETIQINEEEQIRKKANKEYKSVYLYHECSEEEIEKIQENKINEISTECSNTINSGMEIQLSSGEKKYFSYNIEDQTNINEMFNAILMGAESYPYHANNEGCEMYSSSDIVIIYSTLSTLKTSQITYFNQLKQYINSLKSVSDILNIKYGDELTGEYLEKYNSLISSAAEEMQKVLSKVQTYAI